MAVVIDDDDLRWRDHYDDYAITGHTYQPMQLGTVNDKPIFAELPGKHTVVDVGCGYGRAIPILQGLGIRGYLGVDYSEEQVRVARERYPEHRFEVGNLYELGTLHPKEFDGFMLTSVMICIPREKAFAALSSIRASLKQNAIGVVATKAGSGLTINSSGMSAYYYRIEEIEDALLGSGFKIDALFQEGGAIVAIIRNP